MDKYPYRQNMKFQHETCFFESKLVSLSHSCQNCSANWRRSERQKQDIPLDLKLQPGTWFPNLWYNIFPLSCPVIFSFFFKIVYDSCTLKRIICLTFDLIYKNCEAYFWLSVWWSHPVWLIQFDRCSNPLQMERAFTIQIEQAQVQHFNHIYLQKLTPV